MADSNGHTVYNSEAMVTYARRNVAMLTSVGVMVATILMVVFFGAWAVSASSETDVGSLITGVSSGFAGTVGQPSSGGAATDANEVPRLASANPAADTWWGKAFLVACPLH